MAPIPLSVLVVDDHAVVREALTAYLDAEPGLAVWAAVGSGEEALALLGEGLSPPPPTALLVDVQMPGMDGIELVAEVTARHPGVPCVMLSAHAASTYADRARSAGARGFVEKGRPERLVRALRRAIEAPGWVTDDEGL